MQADSLLDNEMVDPQTDSSLTDEAKADSSLANEAKTDNSLVNNSFIYETDSSLLVDELSKHHPMNHGNSAGSLKQTELLHILRHR